MLNCIQCKRVLESRWQKKYCSNRCQYDFQQDAFIALWKAGKIKSSRLNTINISQYLKRYLFQKYGEQCSICSWSQIHPVSGLVPLEVDHIDGNAENNTEKNLSLLCPNCHALTPYFRNRNRGNGRVRRRNSYIKKDTKTL